MTDRFVVYFLLLTAVIQGCTATRTGDEDFGAVTNGVFYVFADKSVSLVSPSNMTAFKNITADQNGSPLTNNGSLQGSSNTSATWNDACYVRGSTAGQQFVMVNEGDTYEASNGSAWSYVLVLYANSQKVIAKVQVGARPVHLYSINQTASAWSHSDAEGTFYVIPANSSTTAGVLTTVKSYTNIPGHGKLIINNYLYPVGYGTNVNEQYIQKFNISTNSNIGSFSFTQAINNASNCTGTHTAVYSQLNKHAYFECIGGGGVLEWNTVTDTFVHLHPIPGVMTGAPNNDLIFVGSQSGSTAAIIIPGANGQPSTSPAVLSVPYNPVYPAFWSSNTNPLTTGNYSSYTSYFPLARNTNLNNIKAAGNNVTTLTYEVAPSDCQYNGTVSASSIEDADDETASSTPGLSLATSGGNAITPSCGACAPGIASYQPSQYNASLSGMGAYNMSGWSKSVSNTTTTLVSAGAILPTANAASGANQCSFTTSYSRAIKRGGNYVAIVANLPQQSLYLVNAASGNNASFVATAAPSSIAWVPSS